MSLLIRHGTGLILRNIIRKVSKEESQTAIIVQRVPECIGCDSREMLMAAREKLVEGKNVSVWLKGNKKEKKNNGIVVVVYGESSFHIKG